MSAESIAYDEEEPPTFTILEEDNNTQEHIFLSRDIAHYTYTNTTTFEGDQTLNPIKDSSVYAVHATFLGPTQSNPLFQMVSTVVLLFVQNFYSFWRKIFQTLEEVEAQNFGFNALFSVYAGC